MKFSSAIIIVAAAISPGAQAVVLHHIASLDSTRLFPGIDFQDDVDAETMSHSDTAINGNGQGRRVFGRAFVFPAFIHKLQKATGKIVKVPKAKGDSHDVQTLYITETTERHVDSVANGYKRDLLKASDADGSMTAFYVQQSTADAYFDTEDDELCLPLVEGDVVYFNGGLPHHTILKSGAVKLVGPFLVSSLKAVIEYNPDGSKSAKPPTSPKSPKSPEPIRNRKLTSGAGGPAFSPIIGVTLASIVTLSALFC